MSMAAASWGRSGARVTMGPGPFRRKTRREADEDAASASRAGPQDDGTTTGMPGAKTTDAARSRARSLVVVVK
jgi:hypothetical protein